MRDGHLIREQVQRSFDDYRTTYLTAGVLVLCAGTFATGYASGRRAERLEGERMVAQVQPPSDDLELATDSNRLSFYADLTKNVHETEGTSAAPSNDSTLDKATTAASAAASLKAGAVERKAEEPRPLFIKPSDHVVGSVTDALSRGPAKPGDYTVQVSSFHTREEARAFASALERKGFKPFVVSADLPGKGTWHRVRIGRFASEDQAKAAKGMLAKSDIPAWVLRSD